MLFHTKIVEIDIKEKKKVLVLQNNVDRSSQVFERLPVQEDTLFKTLTSEIVYPV